MNGAAYHHLPEMSDPMGKGGPQSGYPNHLPPMAPYHQRQQQQQPPTLPPTSHQHQPPPHHHHYAQQQHAPPPPLQHHHIHQQPHVPPHQLPNPHHQQPQPSRHEDGPPLPPPAAPLSVGQQALQRMPSSFSKVDPHSNQKYALDVVQQPRRARMCGFGDKDRRPITPPPCVRLIITDMATLKEVDVNEIDYSMFVLNVDLWNEDGTLEVNLVRSSTGTPSISSTTQYSYTALSENNSNPAQYQQSLPPNRDLSHSQSSNMSYDYPAQQQGYGRVNSSYTQSGGYGPPQQYYPQHGQPAGYRAEAPLPSQGNLAQPGYPQDQSGVARMSVVGGQPQGMFTRNLIGSLSASAFRLHDTQDKIGIWFVLQDLSVRTEGTFRLKFSFVNVAALVKEPGSPAINRGKAPILASCFSEPFSVFSAKKFPGVCESTALSKTFASQGIKIPIRKDSNIKGDGDEEDAVHGD